MTNHRIPKYVVCMTSALALNVSAGAVIADDNDWTFEEIVVTAQKREEKLLDVPISIDVKTQDDLERQQINTLSELSRAAPSLEFITAPGQDVGGGGQVRGVGTQTFNSGAVGAVGVVVDGVSQGNANISDLFDVARVEVLKGPQGTLFGLTTSAGVINITTNKPDFEKISGRVRTELSQEGLLGSGFGLQLVQGVLNVPVSDTSALRLSANVRRKQGVNYNVADEEWDSHKSYNLRGRYLWEPNDELAVNIIGEYSKSTSDGSDFFTIIEANDPSTVAALASCGIVAEAGNQQYCTDRPVSDQSKQYGVSVQVDYDFGPLMLTSISSYRGRENGPGYVDIMRLNNLDLHIFDGPVSGETDLYTQELRLASPSGDKYEYTVGVFVSSNNEHRDPSPFTVEIHPFPGLIIPIVSGSGRSLDLKDTSLAAFGQINYHLTDQLTVIAGGRYSMQDLTVDQLDVDSGVPDNADLDINKFSWKFGLQYAVSDTVMTYATASKGYKGPQVSFPGIGLPANVINPEIPENFEIGAKAKFMDGRLTMDFSAFHITVKDYQGQECDINPVTQALDCFQVNLSEIVSKGVELNFVGHPTKNLIFNVGGIINKVSYPDGYTGSDGLFDLGGEQVAHAPKYKFNASGEYTQDVSGSLEMFLGADAVYKGKIRTDATLDPQVDFAGYWVFGGRVGIRDVDGKWSASIFARNLGNEHAPALIYTSFPHGGDRGAIYGQQSFRQIGLSLDYNF